MIGNPFTNQAALSALAVVTASAVLSFAVPAAAEQWGPVPGNQSNGPQVEADFDSLKVEGTARTMWFRAVMKGAVSGVEMRMDCTARTRSQLRHRQYDAAGKVTKEAPASGQVQPVKDGTTGARMLGFVCGLPDPNVRHEVVPR